MPHSSGGGFHGGGFHGGSGYHGGSSGSRSPVIRSRPFPGAARYFYYRGRRLHYIYSDGTANNSSQEISLVVVVISMIFILFGAFLPVFINMGKEKIDSEFDVGIVIEDRAGVIEDEDELYDVFEDFYDETGIVPSILTVNHSDWNSKFYSALHGFAYNAYTNRFEDEYHWLIVYSVDEDDEEEFVWEGMQGNDTDPVLTEAAGTVFGKRLQRNFESGKYSVDEAVVEAFEYFTPRVMKGFVSRELIYALIFMVSVFGIVIAVLAVDVVKSRRLKNANPWLPSYSECLCEDCGSIYIKGMFNECPFCSSYLSED